MSRCGAPEGLAWERVAVVAYAWAGRARFALLGMSSASTSESDEWPESLESEKRSTSERSRGRLWSAGAAWFAECVVVRAAYRWGGGEGEATTPPLPFCAAVSLSSSSDSLSGMISSISSFEAVPGSEAKEGAARRSAETTTLGAVGAAR